MDTRKQTKVTDQNQVDFFQTVYYHQNESKEQLANLDSVVEPTIVMIDCCGWHYKKLYPDRHIVGLEPIKSVKQFALDRTYFDRLIDNQSDQRIGWPAINLGKLAVVFDRSPLLKYFTLKELSDQLNIVAVKYKPSTVILEQLLTFVDDSRLSDRFYNIATLAIDGYVVNQFSYNTNTMRLSIRFQQKVNTS